jgi:electron transfer flavoprotein alpha subunit
MFHGKLVADVRPTGNGPFLITVQIGAFRADQMRTNSTQSKIVRTPVVIDRSAIRQTPEAPFREAKQAVDLGQATRIVAVGRGIKSLEHLPVAQALADALEAELAASRPICDNGWLPMERQVGSSGQTVAPKLYVALGISGAIQHLVGMKGSRTIVAINKDADAPIFEVADYGIVGDLFEITPALLEELKK